MRIHLSRSILPNLFTVLNIFFGFLCIIHSMQGDFTRAGWYIVLAAVCDTVDGLMARLTRSSSEFGVELDSLADVVSFGAAPSILMYSLFLHEYGAMGTLIAAFPLIFGALRLARFNVQLVGFSKDHFVGVPIPLAALTLLSFMFFMTPQRVLSDPTIQGVFIGLVIIVGLLMVSTFKYPVIPKFSRTTFREHPVQMTIFIIAVVIIAVTMGRAVFPVLFSIILSGIVTGGISFVQKRLRSRHVVEPDEEDDPEYRIDSH